MTFQTEPEVQPPRSRLDRPLSTTVISWQIALVLLLTVVLLLYFLFRSSGLSLPSALGKLPLYREINGSEARGAIAQLHGKEVSQEDNLIGMYGAPEGTATLYASMYGNEEEAAQVYASMASRIGEGGSEFGQYSSRSVDGKIVSVCKGMGQVHYFFAHGRLIYWLAADIDRGEDALRDLLAFADQQQQ